MQKNQSNTHASNRKRKLFLFFKNPDGSFNGNRIALFLAFLTLGLNLRGPITSLPPVIASIQQDLGISLSVAGLLSSIPVLCFGLATPFVSMVQGRITIERAIAITLWGILFGTLLRSVGGIYTIIAGTLILGISMTFGNIVSLLVIARDFKEIRTMMTGILVAAMSVGSMMTSAFTAPVASLFGWRVGISVWAVLALLAIVLWAENKRRPIKPVIQKENLTETAAEEKRKTQLSPAAPVRHRSNLRRPSAWLLAAAFGSHTFMFYGLSAWLPVYLTGSIGISANTAGIALSMFQILGMLGSFGIPWFSSQFHLSHKMLFLLVTTCWFIMAVGTYLAPSYWAIWAVFGGFGSGGGFVVVFDLLMERSSDLDEGRKMSAFVQGLGYIVASTSATLIGALHQWSGSWTSCFVLLAAAAVLMAICGITASLRPPVRSSH